MTDPVAETDVAARRVLVVDDEEGFHDSVRFHLRRKPYLIASAYNGLQMIAALQREPVDLVLLDLKLPGMSGFELLPKLRAREIPTVVVSAHSSISNVVAAVRAGAFDFVDKSLENYDRFDAVIQAAFTHQRWTSAGRDPQCLAELEKLVLALAEIGPRAMTPGMAAACHDELACATDPGTAIEHWRHDRSGASTYKRLCEHFRQMLLRFTLYRCHGNTRQAAAVLGVSYRTFQRWHGG